MIPALKFATRDAEALWAMLADANEAAAESADSVVLLRNQDATVPRVREALGALGRAAQQTPFGFFHLHFSCHGSYDGTLILWDTLWDAIPQTGLPLAEITAAASGVRADLSLVTFDSCFSGTVQGSDHSPNALAYEALLNGLATESRAVAWAAGADERAFESPRFAHGYFSYGLLIGVREARAQGVGRLGLSEWITGAIEFTTSQTKSIGRLQTPQGRIHLRSGADIEVFPDGPRQQRILASQGVVPVGADPSDLRQCGLSDDAIEAIRDRLSPGGRFNALQMQAVAPGGVVAGRNAIVRAPTSAGKTVAGELGILARVAQGRKAVVLLPTRALVHEQSERFARRFARLRLRVIQSAGDVNEQDSELFGQHFDVAFLTYEKFAALVVLRPSALEAVGVVVVDEIQFIRDQSRGHTVELILTRLNYLRRRTGQSLQVIGLCSDVEELNRLHEWMEAEPVGDGSRPVPLAEYVIGPSGRMLGRSDRDGQVVESKDEELAVAIDDIGYRRREQTIRARMAEKVIPRLLADGNQVLAFVATTARARSIAQRLSKQLDLPPASAALAVLGEVGVDERSRAQGQLRQLLGSGVAFHTTDLDRSERAAVEEGFRAGEIRLMVATTTMAMGVNTPAGAVVIIDAELWKGDAWRPVAVTDYRNMAGRAGRLGITKSGAAYLLAHSDSEIGAMWSRFVVAPAEALTSTLDRLPDEDLVVALLMLIGEASVIDLGHALQLTYCGYLNRSDVKWARTRRERFGVAVDKLARAGILTRPDEKRFALSPVGRVCASSGLRISSALGVLRVIDEMTAGNEPFEAREILALAQLTDELDGVYTPLAPGEEDLWLNMRDEWLNSRPVLGAGLSREPDRKRRAERLKRLAGLWSWIDGKPVPQIESLYHRDPGEPMLGRVRQTAERTIDLIWPVGSLIIARNPGQADQVQAVVKSLRWRLEYGVRDIAVALQRLRVLTRAESQNLAARGIDSEEQLVLALESGDQRITGVLSEGKADAVLRRARESKRQRARTPAHEQLIDLFSSDDAPSAVTE